MRLTGNTILITGGTSGIGRALAESLHQRGNQVIIAGRRRKLLDEIAQANPGMHSMELDVQDAQAVDRFAAEVQNNFPALNVLFNNAGITKREDLTADDTDQTVLQSILQTNISSVLQLTAALLPALKRQPSSTIITTTSGLAFVPLAAYPTYSATKAFLHSWLQSLRFQLRETSVEVLEIAPPYVQTELGGPAQATDPAAMPLASFIAETLEVLGKGNPPQGEVLVERVKQLRWAEKSGDYERVFQQVNSR